MSLAREASKKSSRQFVSERVCHVPASGIRKFFDLLSGMEGVISLGVGEPDFVTPWHIREAAIYSIEKGHTMYTSNYGLIELRREVARNLKRLYGVDYNPRNEVLITVGVSEALDLALRAITDPGDGIISTDPCYVAYPACVCLAGGTFVTVPTNCDNDFKVLPRDIEARITERTKALLLGYPCNPTGAVMERAELAQIADIARRNDILVISDEIYDRLVYDGAHTCFPSLPGARSRTILLGGFSKAYAMTGWRVGYAAGPADIIEAMMKIHQYTMLCASISSQMAAIEALKSGEEAVQEMVAEYDHRRRVIVKGLNEIGLSCFEPRGAFYAFPTIKSTGLSSEEFAEQLLVEEKVAVVPGNAFGASGEGHVRCCYATSLSEIEEALERMRRFVEKRTG
ncbi:MAG: aminotransferase class I/II-fold pyridoxal phosphate-dependent enzyme [Chloroflexi bacterium]|nr:aminotransferase class I/II-fold pyridoxal phosphate-dependent enzyme [Chloroflexota bacterium]